MHKIGYAAAAAVAMLVPDVSHAQEPGWPGSAMTPEALSAQTYGRARSVPGHVIVLSGWRDGLLFRTISQVNCGHGAPNKDAPISTFFWIDPKQPNYELLVTMIMSAYVTLSKVTIDYVCLDVGDGVVPKTRVEFLRVER